MTNNLDKKIQAIVKEETKKPQPKRMTVILDPADVKKLEAKAKKLGISKTKYASLLITAGLSN